MAISLEQQLIDLFQGGAWGDENYIASDITRDYLLAREAINKELEKHGLQIRVYYDNKKGGIYPAFS